MLGQLSNVFEVNAMPVRKTVAIAVCKVTYKLMRLMGRTARALPGKLAFSIDRNIIRELSEGHKTIVTKKCKNLGSQ